MDFLTMPIRTLSGNHLIHGTSDLGFLGIYLHDGVYELFFLGHSADKDKLVKRFVCGRDYKPSFDRGNCNC
jgi:hypothetical protein